LPFLPRLRLAGLLYGAGGAGAGGRLGRVVRRSFLPVTDRVGVRLAPSPLGGAARLGAAPRPGAVVGRRATSVRRRQIRRGGGKGMRADRGTPRPALPLLQHRVLREPRRPYGRRSRAPPAGDQDVGRLSRPREGRLRLRRDSGRAPVPSNDGASLTIRR